MRYRRAFSVSAPSSPPVAALVSLGCSKNTVDSEHILAHLVQSGFLLTEDPTEADICLVNTCGFIEAARIETAQTLEELRSPSKGGRPKVIVALGCMPQRAAAAPELNRFLSAADATVTFADYPRLGAICRNLLNHQPQRTLTARATKHAPAVHRPPTSFMRFLENSPRLRIGSAHTAYLKISEGCSNRCRFCSIPLIRGTQVSRPEAHILREAQQLIAAGAKEINLVAQDTTSYGKDRGEVDALARLLGRLAETDSSVWYRVLYAHPRHLTNMLLKTLVDIPCICPYLDIPLQHITDSMLRAMGRGMTQAETLRCIERVRSVLSEGALRTTFIVGYPGETDRDFSQLHDLVRKGLFDHVGVFIYSPEPGTPAAQMKDDVPSDVKIARRDELMRTQKAVRSQRLRTFRGRVLEVMVDEVVSRRRAMQPTGTRLIARTRFDAPEVDGVVYVTGSVSGVVPGNRLFIEITDSTDYDLVGRPAPRKG